MKIKIGEIIIIPSEDVPEGEIWFLDKDDKLVGKIKNVFTEQSFVEMLNYQSKGPPG